MSRSQSSSYRANLGVTIYHVVATSVSPLLCGYHCTNNAATMHLSAKHAGRAVPFTRLPKGKWLGRKGRWLRGRSVSNDYIFYDDSEPQ